MSQDARLDEDVPVLMMAIGPKSLELAGRDPATVRVRSVLATVEDSVPEEQRLRKLVGRLATYLQGYGEVLVRATPVELEPVVEAWRAVRPDALDALPDNPGRMS